MFTIIVIPIFSRPRLCYSVSSVVCL